MQEDQDKKIESAFSDQPTKPKEIDGRIVFERNRKQEQDAPNPTPEEAPY